MAWSGGIRVYYDAAGGTSYTEFPIPCVSIDPPSGGSTTDVNRGHLNSTNQLHTTSPGSRKQGECTFHFEIDTRTHAYWDALQLVAGWWTARTEAMTFKIAWPKLSTDTNAPTTVFHGYVNKQPFPTAPEDDRMMLDLVVKLTDDPVHTDAS
jgi:hypothetical protein